MEKIPPYMQQGSSGPAVLLLKSLLCGAGYGKDLAMDGNYDAKTAERVGWIQQRYRLEVDGNFGPATRAVAKERFYFDFEALCRNLSGPTKFRQPNGGYMTWSPN